VADSAIADVLRLRPGPHSQQDFDTATTRVSDADQIKRLRPLTNDVLTDGFDKTLRLIPKSIPRLHLA
jgi:hypothetical protein